MGSHGASIVRIASVSGSVTDRRHGFADVAAREDVDFIVGDWLSEYNMTMRGSAKINSGNTSSEFESSFLEAIEPALESLASRKIRVAVNAGASDPKKLHDRLSEVVRSKSLNLKIAYIDGDEVLGSIDEGGKNGQDFVSLTTGRQLRDWPFKPMYAQCYLGGWGIVEAFKHNADIVLCGRVADASPTIACAAYHHGWSRSDYPQLAHAFVAGHFIECSTYVTGGNFSGFKALRGHYLDMAFPIVEIESSGEFIVTMQQERDGMVTVDTCKAQLLYEIQGPYYYNSDVVAILDTIRMVEVGRNRVHVTGIGSTKPPPTTKVGMTAPGGYQAEAHYFLCGLDIAEKARMIERQIRHLLDVPKYHTLKFSTNGTCGANPSNQAAATVDFRIFAQARDQAALSEQNFLRPVTDVIMASYPGATFAIDTRQALPKPYYEYFVSILPQSVIKHVCHMPYKSQSIAIEPPTDTIDFFYEQPTYETSDAVPLDSFGPTTIAPLGYIAHARSGDKGSDCNVGFFVRHDDEWDWLRSILTVDKIKELLGEDYCGKKIFRFELPHISAVHFLLKDHLDRGVGANSTYDVLGKNLAEYLRCKHVAIPDRFLARGRI